jgi:hypothetical protein
MEPVYLLAQSQLINQEQIAYIVLLIVTFAVTETPVPIAHSHTWKTVDHAFQDALHISQKYLIIKIIFTVKNVTISAIAFTAIVIFLLAPNVLHQHFYLTEFAFQVAHLIIGPTVKLAHHAYLLAQLALIVIHVLHVPPHYIYLLINVFQIVELQCMLIAQTHANLAQTQIVWLAMLILLLIASHAQADLI